MSADELIRKSLDGIASGAEQAELDRLLAESPRAADLYARASRREQALGSVFREDRAVGAVRTQIRRAAGTGRRRLWIGAAAAVILLAILAGGLLRPAPLATIAGTGRSLRSGDRI
ncbi:MAG TPA: hypothetical protein VEN81_15370, partial [Planctomycetota bacterium]|nr:hypothetical protein [Planctomycetota bacterium]